MEAYDKSKVGRARTSASSVEPLPAEPSMGVPNFLGAAQQELRPPTRVGFLIC